MEKADRHRWARGVLLRAWALEYPTDTPDLAELQTMQAQGAHEGWYGFATKPPQWEGSNNWGAVDWVPGDSEEFFVATDKDKNGNVITVKFKKYATPEAGARDLLHEALTRRQTASLVLDDGNLLAYAAALRAAKYFVAPASLYAQALFTNASEIALALGEPLSVSLDGPKPSNSRASTSLGPLLVVGLGALAWRLWGRRA